MRDLPTERTDTTALNYQTIEEGEEDVRGALKSTLCFDKGSAFIVIVKLFVLRVSVCLFVPQHCWDASVGHHSVPPQAEGPPGAAARLQRGELNERARAQLQQQEDAGEGSDNGHAAEHGDGDGKLGRQLERRVAVSLSHHVVVRGLPHVLAEVRAGVGDGVQGPVGGAGQARMGAEGAARQAGRWALQAGWDGSWCYGVSHCVVDGLLAHREAFWTLFNAALPKEVVPRVALWKTRKLYRSASAQKTQEQRQRREHWQRKTNTVSVPEKTALDKCSLK